MSQSKLIVGCGYLGRRVARRWTAGGHAVAGLVHTERYVEQLRQEGIRPIVADVTRPKTLAALPAAETVLFCVAYDRRSGDCRRAVYADGLRNLLDALPAPPDRFVLISSTGVYGPSAGARVDEESPCRPNREAARALLAAERLLGAHALGRKAIILRLAGLYGADRFPRTADVRAGVPMAVPGAGHLNLIHVDDAAAVVLAAEARARAPRTYCVSDGHPTTHREYYTRLARLLGAPPPRFVEPPADHPSAIRAASDKRVSNARMLAELEVELAYPSFARFCAEGATR